MKVIVKSTTVRQETTSKGNKMIKQQAAIDQGRDYPLPFELVVDEPYQPGNYQIKASSFRVNQFGGLELNPYQLELELVKAA